MSAAQQQAARGQVTVDLNAVEANYRTMAENQRPDGCAAVVKANAYGLGVKPIARRLARAGCRDFFVASVTEGMELRAAVPPAAIYIFDGFDAAATAAFLEHDLIPVLNTPAQQNAWQRCNKDRPNGAANQVWHVDTGMSRLGMSEAEAIELAAAGPPDLLLTHLACADQPDHPANADQLAAFERVRRHLGPCPISVGSTAGSQLAADPQGDLCRVGIGLYGSNISRRPAFGLAEAVQVHGAIVQQRRVPAGTPVGYDASFVTDTASVLLTIGVGYADGYLRSLGNAGWACLDHYRLPVVGRVSMDYLVVDATAVPAAVLANADQVALIGDGVNLDELAAAAGTISYEMLCRLGSRLPVRYLD